MTSAPTTFKGLINAIISLINVIIPVLFAFLFLFVMWKLIDAWIINSDNETKREEAKGFLLTAILVMVLMVSTWGIVAMIKQSFFG